MRAMPARPLRWFLLALVAAVVAVPGGASATTVVSSGFDAALLDRIDRAAASAFLPSRSPGYAVGVWAPGRGEYLRAYGVANRRTGAPAQVEDHFRIASLTKTMTAVAVLRLVDQGRLSLHDRLARYVPGVPNGRRITIRQLLGMRAGIHDFTNDPRFALAVWHNPLMPWAPAASMRVVRSTPPDFTPGTQGRYSNANYIVLGRVIERVTGLPARQVIRDEVLVPAGLDDTTVPTGSGLPGPLRRGYALVPGTDDLRDVTLQNPGITWTAGAGVSTLGDLGRWARILASGALLTPATHAQQMRGTRLHGMPMGSAYGLGLVEAPGGWIGHLGYVDGYSTAMYHQPSTGVTIVTAGNDGADDAFVAVARALGLRIP